jgi:VCBS repeat-containing protein
MSSSNRKATVVPVTKNVNEGNSIADLTITGTITVNDDDNGQNKPKSSTIVGTYGTFQVSTSGTWTYTPTSALNQLTAGQTVKETFTVTSFDGSDTGTVTINITGTNDVPTMTSATSDVTEGATAAAISANGKITVTDLDTGESYAKPATVTTSYGTFAVDKNGNWTYVANGAHNELIAGQKVVETFTVTSQDNTKTSTVTVNITGSNDVATVTSDTKALAETNSASSISSSGKLTVADADTGEALVTASTVNTTYGKFTVDTNGNWTYVANDAHNELTAGQAVKEEFTVASKDGTASGKVTINITGANDVASVTSATKELTETNSAADLSTSGKLTVADADAGQAYVTSQTVKGTMGTFTVDANGNWSYTADSAHDELLGGQVVTETFTVASQDKSASGKVTINITGTNDVAVVSSDTADLTETNDAIDLSVVGKLSITDGDNGQAFVQAYVKEGALGTFAIDTEGNWSYTADSAHDELYQGQVVTEEFTVVSQDGLTSSIVTVNITGSNDAPVLSVSTDAVEIQQGIWNSVEGIATATATDADTGHTLTYALVDNADGYFTIDEDTGVIGLTHEGAGAIADKPEGPWVVQVQATDDITAESNIEEIQIDVKMAVADDTATLPGNINDWNIQPAVVTINEEDTTDGFIATRHDDDTIAVKIPDSVSTLNFDNGSLGLAHNLDGAGVITDATPAETGSHTITIAPGTTENTVVVIASGDMAPGSTTTVVGATDSDMGWDGEIVTYRSDTVQVIDAAYADATITTDHSNQQVTVAVGDTKIVLQDVETVQFTDATVRIVGAGGYATVADAQAEAGEDDVVYFSPITVTTADGADQGATIEDDGLTAGGQLGATQSVAGAETITWSVTATDGTYGSIEIDPATGSWKYTLANDATAVQELNAGAQRSDSFVAVATDGQGGTVEQTVTVDITGKNDGAEITGVATDTIVETDTVLSTGGKLDVVDVDLGEAAFVAQTDTDGSNGYGTFSIAEDGTWTYATTTDHNEFVDGVDYTDSVTVNSIDGTSQIITVSITGTNDAADISGADTAVVLEADGVVSASGELTASDIDSDAVFVAQSEATGDSGYGEFSIDADGKWSYSTNSAHNDFEHGVDYTDSITVATVDGTEQVISVVIRGTNDSAEITGVTTGEIVEADTALSTGGKLDVTDIDSTAEFVEQTDVVGAHGTFSIASDGAWTYVANSANNELAKDEVIGESFTVATADGTETTINVSITGTNDAPVLDATHAVTVTQGAGAVDNLETVHASDIDGPAGAVQYSLVSTVDGMFTIDAQTGKIGLTQAGAETISGLHESGVVPKYTLGVTATDGLNVSTQENITVNVDMAVDGTSAYLPGSISEWTIAAQVTGGYVLTNTADPLIKIALPGAVNTLSFDGQSVELANNGTLGTITDKTVAGVDHTIVIAPGTAESDLIVLSKAGVQTVVGAEDTGSRTDAIKIDYTLDVSHANSVFSVVDSGHIVLHTGTGSTVISDVESVQFINALVRMVGAGGYESLTHASTDAAGGTVIYVSDASLATGAKGVIQSTNLSIYIANGDGATMTFGTGVVNPEVRVYGEHSFNINGSAGSDTVHDYTLLSSKQVATINGMDGADTIVVHETGGTHIVSGGGGADTLIGGTGSQLSGGDGNDTLLATGGGTILSGGAGNDILLNSASGGASVTLIGGSGSDTFALIAKEADSGIMKTVIADLGIGDKIDLSFIEQKNEVNKSIDTAAEFTAAGGKATMNTAGTTLNFSQMVVTESESDADINSKVNAGSITVSNATLSKVSTAITDGHDTLSTVDFSETFGHLTDTYMHTA